MKQNWKIKNCSETRVFLRSAWMRRPSLTHQLRGATAHICLELRSILVFCGPALCWLNSTCISHPELIQQRTTGSFWARKKKKRKGNHEKSLNHKSTLRELEQVLSWGVLCTAGTGWESKAAGNHGTPLPRSPRRFLWHKTDLQWTLTSVVGL